MFIQIIKWYLVFFLGVQVFANLELNESGKLYVATSGEFPPLSILDENGELKGIEVDLMREICKRLRLEYKPIITKFESILAGVLTNKFDISTESMDITVERSKKVFFINWLQSAGVIVALNPIPVNYIEDIKNKKIGTQVSSTWADEAEHLGATNIVYYSYNTAALMDLLNKKIDYVITTKITVEYFLKLCKQKLFMREIKSLQTNKGWAINKKRPNLYKAISEALEAIYKDGTYNEIVTRYIDHNPYPRECSNNCVKLKN